MWVGVDPNPTSTSRTGQVRVEEVASGASRMVAVTQTGKGSGVAMGDAATLPSMGFHLDVPTGLSGTLTMASDATWLTASIRSDGMMGLEGKANSTDRRTGIATVRASGTAVATYGVAQRGVPTVAAGAATWSVTRSGGSQSRTVTSNLWDVGGPEDIRVSTSEAWLHVPPGTLVSGTSLAVAADPNTTGASRVGTVWVFTSSATTSFQVTQAP